MRDAPVTCGCQASPVRRAVLGFYTYVEFFIILCTFLPIFAVLRLLFGRDPVKRMQGKAMRIFGRTTGRLTPLWRFTTHGEPPADIHSRAYVVIANHESTADPFLIANFLWDMRWVAKEELFRTPFVGWALRLCGDIRVRRGNGESVREMLDECRLTLEHGMPLMLFPEGTRSRDSKVLPFKDGAFQLAIETGSPILPIAIAGTRECMPKNSLWFGDTAARARVLAPIPTEGLSADDIEPLKARARQAIQAAADQLRRDIAVAEGTIPAEGISVQQQI